MRNHVPPDEPRCLCGAFLDEDQTLCRKCRARYRWRRRHSIARRHRRRPDDSSPF